VSSSFSRPALLAAALLASMALAGCDHAQGGSTSTKPPDPMPGIAAITAVPLGDIAGSQNSPQAAYQPNPYAHDPQAVAEGKNLFIAMNCAGCHGYGATGGMGPNLTDRYWRYGGAPVSIFKSIYEGRPQGMPAWNPALPPQDIWKIVAYVQSLGGSFPPEAFEASIEGDRAGNNVPPGVRRTLPAGAEEPKATAGSSATASPGEARPDAGGKP
jgi:cytochrome c oxidase cbb3-type subunit III